VINSPGTLTDFNTGKILLNGVVFDTRITVNRQIALFNATTCHSPRPVGCQAFTSATPSTNGDNTTSRLTKNKNGSRLNTAIKTSPVPTDTNHPVQLNGASTVPMITASPNPSFSAAGSRCTGLSNPL